MELVQTEKVLSFEEICPTWSRLLSENGGFINCRDVVFKSDDGDEKNTPQMKCQKNIMKCSSCIVGEAHDN